MRLILATAKFRRYPHDQEKETAYQVSEEIRRWIEQNLEQVDADTFITVKIGDLA